MARKRRDANIKRQARPGNAGSGFTLYHLVSRDVKAPDRSCGRGAGGERNSKWNGHREQWSKQETGDAPIGAPNAIPCDPTVIALLWSNVIFF
jgi:hypothetical protein